MQGGGVSRGGARWQMGRRSRRRLEMVAREEQRGTYRAWHGAARSKTSPRQQFRRGAGRGAGGRCRAGVKPGAVAATSQRVGRTGDQGAVTCDGTDGQASPRHRPNYTDRAVSSPSSAFRLSSLSLSPSPTCTPAPPSTQPYPAHEDPGRVRLALQGRQASLSCQHGADRIVYHAVPGADAG